MPVHSPRSEDEEVTSMGGDTEWFYTEDLKLSHPGLGLEIKDSCLTWDTWEEEGQGQEDLMYQSYSSFFSSSTH